MVHFVRRLFSMVLSRLDAAVYARNSFTVAPRISSGFLSQPDGFSASKDPLPYHDLFEDPYKS